VTSTLTSLPLAGIPPEDEALRAEVRGWLTQALRDVPADVRSRSWLGYDLAFSRALARQGWIGLTLPREYGGAGRGSFARFVLSEELLAAGAPVAAHWIADRQTAQLILRFGSEAQRQFFLPRIARVDIVFCIGMSEPDTGSDLASVRTRATRTADGWLLNGRKIWTTNAHRADYMCALVRTSGSAEDRHQGLSQVLVDMKLPGVSVRPLRDIAGDTHFNEVLFDNVLLPPDAVLGEEGAGWRQVTAELAFERSGPERVYSSIVLADTWLAEVRAAGLQTPAVRATAGRIAGRLAVLRGMSLAVAAKLERGERPDLEAAFVKDLGTEFEQAVPEWIRETLEATPDFAPSAELMRSLAYVTQISPTFSLRGGTRQIMRGIIARGLGLR
jgi:alkylation response protein AidB-like acyl-CoA dehydrogenase